MNEVEEYIFELDGTTYEILQFFHLLLIEEYGLTPKLRFKIPFYYTSSWICYLNPLKNDQVELCFIRGRELSNKHGLLLTKGRKLVAGFTLTSLDEIPLPEIHQAITEAIDLT